MSRIKIIQIESAYRQHLINLFGSLPNFSDLSYQLTLSMILNSGWSSGQNVGIYLDPNKYEIHYLVPTFSELQTKWFQQRGLNSPENPIEMLMIQLEMLKPDIVYFSDINVIDLRLLGALSKRPVITAWLASSLNPTTHLNEVDLLLSGVSAIRENALKNGAKAVANFMSGAPSYFSANGDMFARQEKSVISGSFVVGYHDNRLRLLEEAAERLGEGHIDIYTDSQITRDKDNIGYFKGVYARDVVDLYSCYNTVIDSRADFGLGEKQFARDTSNMRIFEATKAGALLVTEFCNNLAEYFDIGNEILCFKSQDELVDILRHYSKHPEQAGKIARAGHLRTVRQHSVENRAIWFDEILNKNFSFN